MKLISITILVLSFAINGSFNEQFVFPPKFQTPSQYVSDSSLYLPPESHTPIPYFPMKKLNNLPFPYLPPTATKTPMPFPPFPMVLSSTLVPNFEEDDDESEESNNKAPNPPIHQQFNRNRTSNEDNQIKAKREMRPIPKHLPNYQHPIDRIDVKMPPPMPNGFQTPNPNQTSRSLIISAEHRNDLFDQIRAGASQNTHFVSPPGTFISPTTEPAIPIVRLSNEMDLDGSFSYEALGADQTHYVQHSHMENLGTDKAEQVVEGSYSYVGDNGQTYTVHYIADSNGFRASGDHLPVAPPIPEIIQRSIQYNLAEEAKKPQQLKSWQPDDHERDYNEINDNTRRFSLPPPRNLFTGRTPEAFSYDFAQRANSQNNLATAASSQIQIKATPDFTNNQSKINNLGGPILPQVTFLASQGAHIPKMNSPTPQLARMFTTEKSLMPQLVNYEADDNNKALWRWQYGLNSNNNPNQAPEKNTISRSSGMGDDVMINFNDMTPDQYTKMLHTQVSSTNSMEKIETSRDFDNTNTKENVNDYRPQNIIPNNQYIDTNKSYKGNDLIPSSTEKIATQLPLEGWYKPNGNTNTPYFQQIDPYANFNEKGGNPQEHKSDSRRKLNPEQDELVTEYNFEDSSYEARRIKALHPVTSKPYANNINQIHNDYGNMITPSYAKVNTNEIDLESKFSATHVTPTMSTTSVIKFSDFITNNDKDNFKPVLKSNNGQKQDDDKPINDNLDEFTLQNNIFLTKLMHMKNDDQRIYNKMVDDTEKQFVSSNNNNYNVFKKTNENNNIMKIQNIKVNKNEHIHNKMPEQVVVNEHRDIKLKNAETKSDKISQYVKIQNKQNENNVHKKKPLDINDVLNYITMKNNFESSKVKAKNNPINFDNYNLRHETHFIPLTDHEHTEKEEDYNKKQNTNNIRVYQQPGELRGNIKNYKVLHRHNNIISSGYDNSEIKRDLVPPPKMHNLPPLGRAGPSTRSYLPPTFP